MARQGYPSIEPWRRKLQWRGHPGIRDRIMHRRHKSQEDLPQSRKRHNALIARRRAPVESIFSVLKRIYGQGRARCRSGIPEGWEKKSGRAAYTRSKSLQPHHT
jgi:hypothetical protein